MSVMKSCFWKRNHDETHMLISLECMKTLNCNEPKWPPAAGKDLYLFINGVYDHSLVSGEPK